MPLIRKLTRSSKDQELRWFFGLRLSEFGVGVAGNGLEDDAGDLDRRNLEPEIGRTRLPRLILLARVVGALGALLPREREMRSEASLRERERGRRGAASETVWDWRRTRALQHS
ncbi:hypothetical protein MRB53_035492 [Persea americana]|uniref:Uncharacterized protein n=1 Tax=Persea americana TaxID=3435 RepID=A0ACC2K4S1_PERAE|nr:hypothetical protein MRB53_035492 [Persea americana]